MQEFLLPIKQEALGDVDLVSVKVEGLTGGHSGVDIMLGGGNAIKVCACGCMSVCLVRVSMRVARARVCAVCRFVCAVWECACACACLVHACVRGVRVCVSAGMLRFVV